MHKPSGQNELGEKEPKQTFGPAQNIHGDILSTPKGPWYLVIFSFIQNVLGVIGSMVR